jgi:hypothetical protein
MNEIPLLNDSIIDVIGPVIAEILYFTNIAPPMAIPFSKLSSLNG